MEELNLSNKRYSLSVIFPVYNEEGNIEKTVDESAKFLSTHRIIKDYEIILVNDGSKDNTEKILNQLSEKIPCTKIITHRKNLGYGAALTSGLVESRYPFVLFMDADGQFNISEIDKLISFADDYDIIIGNRYNRKDSFWRVALGRIYGWLVFLLLGLKFKDINCGFKLFKRGTLNLENTHTSNGGVFYAEIFSKAKGCKVKEVPVGHFPRLKGKQTGASKKVIVNAVMDLIKLKMCLKQTTKMQAAKRKGLLSGNAKILILGVGSVILYSTSILGYNLEEYYPMNQGNIWEYSVTDDEESDRAINEIKGKEIIDGKEVIKMLLAKEGDCAYLHFDSEGVKIYKNFKKGEDEYKDEYIMYRPPRLAFPNIEIGLVKEYSTILSEYSVSGEKKEEVAETGLIKLESIEDIEVPAGKFTDCLKFSVIYNKKASGVGYEKSDCEIWLAPGIGKVEEFCIYAERETATDAEESSFKIYKLISAVINGKKIGSQE
ncbi:glycosyltransferase family 2 protein [bacterium]|nr:MAG: glycosyltransferase family 2 protein [bacterium]